MDSKAFAPQDLYERLYRSLYRIRRVEEEVARVYPTDKIKSPVHLSIGQEAVAVGICEALQPQDVVFGTYRSHASYLAKGGNLEQMIAELYGKATGCAKGKGGSMHLIDLTHNVMGTSAVVGTTIANAIGYAYALKYRREAAIAVSFFGDGAVDEGVWHESLNFAALKKLPILFVCENNRYAIHTHQLQRQPLDNICDRARSYGMPAVRIEDGDVMTIYDQAEAAVKSLRAGEGPIFLECITYRWREHVGPNEDYHLGYRTKQEAEPWIASDAVRKLRDLLQDRIDVQPLEAAIEAEIQAAFAFAETSAFPELNELYTDVFKEVVVAS